MKYLFMLCVVVSASVGYWGDELTSRISRPAIPANPSNVCEQAIMKVARGDPALELVMRALAKTESNFQPWVIMANGFKAGGGQYCRENKYGSSCQFPSSVDAIAAARGLMLLGHGPNFDAGCMQINLKYHGKRFNSIEEAFDPLLNVQASAEFLRELFAKHKNWKTAMAYYHSGNSGPQQRYMAIALPHFWDAFSGQMKIERK